MSGGCCDGLPEPIGGILRRRMALASCRYRRYQRMLREAGSRTSCATLEAWTDARDHWASEVRSLEADARVIGVRSRFDHTARALGYPDWPHLQARSYAQLPPEALAARREARRGRAVGAAP